MDVNHAEIVAALREAGCSVTSLAAVGRGCPDLVVGVRGRNYLLEVKPPGGARGGTCRQSLTDDEREWHRTWRGQRAIVTTIEQALYAVGVMKPAGEAPKPRRMGGEKIS